MKSTTALDPWITKYTVYSFRHFTNKIAEHLIYYIIDSWGHSLLFSNQIENLCIFSKSAGIILTFSVQQPPTSHYPPMPFWRGQFVNHYNCTKRLNEINSFYYFLFNRNTASTLNVTAGKHDLSHEEPGEQTLTIESIIIHPQFSTKKPMDYDIALLKMAGTFRFGNHFRLTLNYLFHVLHKFCSIVHSL